MKKKVFTILFALFAIATTAQAQNTINGHEYVDLGLPSGTLWATCNVGASKPEEYGLYFAWGETKGYTSDTSDGHSFNEAYYKWCNGAGDKMTKYCTNSSDGNNGFKDNKTELDLEDDAAYVNWGSSWRMPSREQLGELRIQCKWERTQLNGVYGYKVTGPNGNSIFLPAAGYRRDKLLRYAGSEGCYWSRTLAWLYPRNARVLSFDSRNVHGNTFTRFRCLGQSVRPVRQK